MIMTSPLRGPESSEGGGFAAAHLLMRRACYGAAPPAPRVLRIALRATPGGPGESHPRAPTERSVTVSRHSARPIYRLYLESVTHAQCANRRGCLAVSPSHHLRTFLNDLSRLYFRFAQRTR